MMSKKQWFVLLTLFVIYLLLGASFFYHIENREETLKNANQKSKRLEVEDMLRKHYLPSEDEGQEDIFEKISDYCGKPLHFEPNDEDVPIIWDFYHSLFFVVTVCTTVGYGNLAPTTMTGRIFMIFYALVGVPVNGILMVNLGDYFGKSFVKLYRRWKTAKMEYDTTRLGLISQIILYLVPGFTLLIFIPSVIIMIFEGWEYDVAVYYSFVTLSTIGFGDYVAGVADHGFPRPYFTTYKIFLLFWMIIGLGYLVMVMGFISRAYRSKKLHALEHMLAQKIKRTPQTIREEIRNLLHDVLLTKVKKVYKEERDFQIRLTSGRSNSCPDLDLYRNMDSPTMMKNRKRAFSETTNQFGELPRNQSDSELDKIDKELTFKPTLALMEQSDLLLRVVNALGTAIEESSSEETLEGGVSGFSDQEILASERYGSAWTIISNQKQSYPINRFGRDRAASEVKFPFSERSIYGTNHMTWFGTSAAQNLEEFKLQMKNEKRQRTLSMPAPIPPKSVFSRIKNTFKKDDDKSKNIDVEKQDYLQKTMAGRDSSSSAMRLPYLSQLNRRRGSSISAATPNSEGYPSPRRARAASVVPDDPILEQTSIAELFRILSGLEETEVEPLQPRRKLGTATLTPPKEITPPKTRRMPIKSNLQRRRSSAVSFHTPTASRRFSLMPVAEAKVLPNPPPPYTPRNASPTGVRAPGTNRRFSLRPASSGTQSPIQRQVWKAKEERKEL